MRRLAVLGLVVLVVVGGVAAGRPSGDDGAYLVRALFANASFVNTGEDVKVAGVVVGSIERVELSDRNQAAVVLRISDPVFADFRADARCRVRLQSLIGEQFVECTPTEPRAAGTPLPPPLRRVGSGPARGQHVLPIARTSSPVGPDLIGNIQRLPERERLRLIVAELGTGLAANGGDLRAAVRRGDPALQQADRFVATLAAQDRVLARLVTRSDAVLAPLARRRRSLSGFVDHAGETAAAAAEQGEALEGSLRRLPAFLTELRGATERLGRFADQADPALSSLEGRAGDLDRLARRLAPLSSAAIPAFESLGRLADRGRTALPAVQPLASDISRLAVPLRPLAANLGDLTTSFAAADGIPALLRFVLFYTGTVNGQDGVSHYIRSALGVNQCADRIAQRTPVCIGTFASASAASASTSSERTPSTAEAGLDFLLGQDEAPAP